MKVTRAALCNSITDLHKVESYVHVGLVIKLYKVPLDCVT